MAITVVLGAPCSGKSTWANSQLQANDVIVDYDELAKAFGSKIPHSSFGSIRTVALAARKEAIKRILNGIDNNAFIIHTNPNDEAVQNYVNSEVNFVLLNPGIDECLKRAESRPKGTIEAIYSWFENPPHIINELNLQPINSVEDSSENKLLNILKEWQLNQTLNLRLGIKS